MGYFADMLGTLRSTFRINMATVNAGALTAARNFALPDLGGTVALTSQLGNVTATQVTLDFGSMPVRSKGFTFSDAVATTASKILMTPAADSDEYEMDGFACAAYCAANGVITTFVQALPGPVTGLRKFNYMIG